MNFTCSKTEIWKNAAIYIEECVAENSGEIVCGVRSEAREVFVWRVINE